ncbi:MAG: PAS domain S-box protein, partial [Deltaproteobacteria bacterium]|nr:PAS domain S-box protein [Deltaproteobacteria bacterium]
SWIEEELNRSKQICHTILNAIPNSISLIDVYDFKIIDANEAFLDSAGLRREEVIGKPCHKINHFQPAPCNSPDYVCPVRQVLKTGVPSIVEHQHYQKNGELVNSEISVFPIKGTDGEIIQAVNMSQDITARKRAEEKLIKRQVTLEEHVAERMAELVRVNKRLKQEISDRMGVEEELRKSEEKFRTVADFTYDWEIWRGMDGNLIYVSPSCERITGYKANEFIEDPNLLLSIIHPDDQHNFRSHLTDIERYPNIHHIDFRIIRRDGQERWISHYCQPVYNAEGHRLGYRSSNRDVSNQKMAEKQILEYQEQLRLLASELSLAEARERRQLSIDLHDGIGQTLAMCQITAQQLQQSANSQAVKKSTNHLIQLIDMAISDTRSLTFNISPPSLYELSLEAAVDELAEQIQNEYGIKTVLEDDERPKFVNLDSRITLYRAIRELMFNVVKHSRARHMKISIAEKDGCICIGVSDDGIGFDPARIESQSARSKSFGLFSVRERLMFLGGHVEIQSSPGDGAKVLLVMPLEHGH